MVSSQTALTCGSDCDTAAGVVDFVGYGTANDSEGTAPAPGLSNTTSGARDTAGQDTDNNAADFTAGPLSPQSCGDACVTPARVASIAQIQGAAHVSTLRGSDVADVTGVITARKNNGYYLQDPRGADAPGYVTGASSAVLVFTGTAPAGALQPGTSVSVDGTVTEFRPGSTGLSITQISNPTSTVVVTDVPLPAPTLIGPGGAEPPGTVIDDDAAGGAQIDVDTAGTFQPNEDGIDFWESLEAMRVELDDARVVGPTSQFSETPIVPSGAGVETARGGILLRASDPNPERVLLEGQLGVSVPAAHPGRRRPESRGHA